ncbi:hypothetical protein CS8_091190 [Cupriavidus sp. 8B]
MNRVVPWADLVMLIASHAPEGKRGRPTFAIETMPRIHFLQQWFGLSDPAMEEALHDRCTPSLPGSTTGRYGYPTRAPSCDSVTC